MDRIEDGRTGRLSRRQFLEGGGILAGAAAAGIFPAGASAAPADPAPADDPSADLGTIPRRKLGKTGEMVSILGLGTACMGEGPEDADECAVVFSGAIDVGITCIALARMYVDAQTALKKVLPTRRDKVFLGTKCMTDTREEAEKSFETSLREMGVDHVDLLHLHSTGDRDLDKVLGPG